MDNPHITIRPSSSERLGCLLFGNIYLLLCCRLDFLLLLGLGPLLDLHDPSLGQTEWLIFALDEPSLLFELEDPFVASQNIPGTFEGIAGSQSPMN